MLEKIDDFLNYLSLEKGSPPNTLIAYQNDLTQFVRFLNERGALGIKSWDDVDRDMIIAYILAPHISQLPVGHGCAQYQEYGKGELYNDQNSS